MKKIMKNAVASALALMLAGSGIPSVITAGAAEDEIDLVSASVALDDSITLRFYITMESVDALEADSVTLTGPNETIIYTSYKHQGDKYVFSYPLYATQLGEKVSIQFMDANKPIAIDEATDDDPYTYSYSIYDYCSDVAASDEYDEETKKAVGSLRNLGLAAENYFKHSGNQVNFYDTEYDLAKYAPDAADDVKFSLVLDSKFSARVYPPGLPLNVHSDNPRYYDDPGYPSVEGKNGNNCFEETGLGPLDLDDEIKIVMNETEIIFTPLSFCYRALANNSEKSTEIAKAVYEYYKYVRAYYYSRNAVTIYNNGYNDYGTTDYGPFRFEYTPGMTWGELVAQVNDDSLLSGTNGIYVGPKKLELYNNDTYVYTTDVIEENGDYYVLDFAMYTGD